MKKLREYKGVTYDESVKAFRYDGTTFDRAADVIARGYRLTDDDHAALMDLKANPYEQTRKPEVLTVQPGAWLTVYDKDGNEDGYDITKPTNVVWYSEYKKLAATLAAVQDERESVSSHLYDCMNERDALKERLAPAQRVVETAQALCDEFTECHQTSEARWWDLRCALAAAKEEA